jgi:uncharacterized protein
MSAWIQTFTGREFHYHAEKPDIHIEDIAQGLSNQSRYAGQCKHFYSVAQHTVLGVDVAMRVHGNMDLARVFFLHDASEAYLVDVPRPIKGDLKGYTEIEDRISKAIYDHFNISGEVVQANQKLCKEIDMRILITEKNQLFDKYHKWTMEDEFPEYHPETVSIQYWTPQKARKKFLNLYGQLFGGMSIHDPVINTDFLFADLHH